MDFDFNIFLEQILKKLHLMKKDNIRRLNLSPSVFDTIIRAFMSFLLLSTDFALFVGSGNFNIFRNGFYSVEVCYILFIFAMFISLVYALFSKFRFIQDILVSSSFFIFIYALYNQFAQFDFHGFLAEWFSLSSDGFFGTHSEAAVSIIIALIAFIFYQRNNRQHILYLTMSVCAIFIGVMLNKFSHQNPKDEFIVSFNNQQQVISVDEDKGQKAIFFFFPQASSYKIIAEWKNLPEAQDTVDKILAFYAKNRFEIFPNAYVENSDQYLNLIASLNSQRNDRITDNIMNTKMLYRYWRFFNLINEYIYPQRNDLIETYNNSGYKTTAYKSRVVDLCTKKHKMNVNRCVEKIGIPTNVFGKSINFSEKTKLILAEWLDSLKIFGNLSGMYKMFSVFSDMDKIPLVGINYSNLYVINSIYTFDKLLEDMTTDKENQAYFVFVDLPADMYIYNEFCEIKPTSQWMNLNDLPWIRSKNQDSKKRAYLQQTKCLYGKLEDFMQKLKNTGLLDQTTIVIQGISSFVNDNYNAPFVENFLKSRVINMAYREENPQYFKVSENICNTSNILNYILYGGKICDDMEGVNAHISIKRDIYNELNKYKVDEGYLQKAVNDFNSWFEGWKAKNPNRRTFYGNPLQMENIYDFEEDNSINDDFSGEFSDELEDL